MHNEDGIYALDANGYRQYNLHQVYLSDRHIVYELENDINNTVRNTINGQLYGTINFLNDFSFTVRGNVYLHNMTQKNYNNPESGDGMGNNGRMTKYDERSKDYNFAQELYWAHDVDKHHIDVFLSHESYKHSYFLDYAAKTNQKVAGDNTELSNFSVTTYAAGSNEESTTESYLARSRYHSHPK